MHIDFYVFVCYNVDKKRERKVKADGKVSFQNSFDKSKNKKVHGGVTHKIYSMKKWFLQAAVLIKNPAE